MLFGEHFMRHKYPHTVPIPRFYPHIILWTSMALIVYLFLPCPWISKTIVSHSPKIDVIDVDPSLDNIYFSVLRNQSHITISAQKEWFPYYCLSRPPLRDCYTAVVNLWLISTNDHAAMRMSCEAIGDDYG